MTSVAIVTLGCARNEVDSEQLGGLLARSGYRLVEEADGADVVLVNTCTFITPATQESVDTVLAACDLKDVGTQAVVVVGCMAERYGDELAGALPEADAVVGFGAYPRLPEVIDDVLAGRTGATSTDPCTPPAPALNGRALPLLASPAPASVAGPVAVGGAAIARADDLDRIPPSGPRFPLRVGAPRRPWAYLKIASGCDRVCTFCAIPSWRGRFRSRPMEEIVTEARWLVERGARELVLVSENTTSWGRDLSGGTRTNQPALLRALDEVDGLERVRLMYLQPAELQQELLEAMAATEVVVPYFDLSLQHASGRVLDRMARSGSRERFLELVGRIRSLAPEAVFRSNFIVGFPGETDGDVDDLASFLTEARLDWVGLFGFSPQDGTPAADYADVVPDHVIGERLAELSELQEAVAEDAARRFVGRRLEVTVEGDGPEGTWGRSYREAPETDGEVRLLPPGAGRGAMGRWPAAPIGVGAGGGAPVGRSVLVEVIAAEGVDLLGVPVEAERDAVAGGVPLGVGG